MNELETQFFEQLTRIYILLCDIDEGNVPGLCHPF